MDISSNPWVITAADVAAGPVTVWALGQMIKGIEVEFTQYINTTDNAVVNQANGKLLAFLKGAGDLQTVRTGRLPGPFNGIVIPVNGITATGTVRIYHD